MRSETREDGQKVLLAIKSMGSESKEAWRTVFDDLINNVARLRREGITAYAAYRFNILTIRGQYRSIPLLAAVINLWDCWFNTHRGPAKCHLMKK